MSINVVDIETYGSGPVVPYCMGMVVNGKTLFTYGRYCVRRGLIEIFKKSVNNTIFYAHNLTFDGLIIIENMGGGFELDSRTTFMMRGNVYSLGIRYKGTLIIFRCSFRLLPMGLADVAEMLKIPAKGEFDHLSINADNFMSRRDEVIAYCRRDLEITVSLLVNLNRELYPIIPEWRKYTSISSVSLRLMKNLCPEVGFKLGKKYDSAIRQAFYGGRCEVFGNAEDGERVFHFDFSGMYSNRLLESLPEGLPTLVKRPSCIKMGFYSVRVRSEGFDIPILPYRDVKSGKLLFPNGVFNGVYWSGELKLFKDNGGIIEEIFWGYEFKGEGRVLQKFASKCLELRGDGLSKVLWKLIPNSLVGRLGLRVMNEETLLVDEKDFDPFDENIISDTHVNSKYLVRYRKLESGEDVSGNVIIPAVITSEARKLWWLASRDVIKGGGRILYCDTDSIYASFNRDVRGETHGSVYWDPENKETVVDEAIFAISKGYCVKYGGGEFSKIKGVKRNTIGIEEFRKNFEESKTFEMGVLKFSKADFKVKINHNAIKKINLSQYKKRVFNVGKTRTTPLWIYPR